MARIPGHQSVVARVVQHVATYDIFIALSGLVLSIAGIIDLYRNNHSVLAWVTIVGAAGVTLSSIGKAVLDLRRTWNDASPHALEGCLNTIHALLQADDSSQLRLTIHVPSGEQLQQITEYVGHKRGNQKMAGRSFPAQSGIIGQAFRRKEFIAASRRNDDYEGYITELVEHWHYLENDARKLSPASMSWMAIPLVLEEKVEAIVYLDSTDREFFDDEYRRNIAILGCAGIARFVHGRYG